MRVEGRKHGDVAPRPQDAGETTWSVDREGIETCFAIGTHGSNGGGATQAVQLARKRAVGLVRILRRKLSI